MPVNDKDVSYIADLANLALADDERSRLVRDLNSILAYVDHLNELDTNGIEPMAQSLAATQSDQRSNQSADSTRDDVHNGLRESLSRNIAMQNAPDTNGSFFLVPKVIEK